MNKSCRYSLRIEIISATFDINRNDRIARAQLDILFNGQLSHSPSVTIESDTLVFNHIVEYDLINYKDPSSIITDSDYTSTTPIVISLIECLTISNLYHDFETIPVSQTNTKNLKALSIIDMRLSAIYSSNYISVELIPTDCDLIASTLAGSGTLYLKLSVIDNYSDNPNSILPPLSITDAEILTNKINIYQKSISKTCHENYQRVKSWLHNIRKSHPWLMNNTTHPQEIKLLTQDETGQNRFVNSFLGPLYCPRDISNPRSSARFVSLLPFKQTVSLTGENSLFAKSWKSSSSILSSLHGDVQDHAILLCNMLLGWGLHPWIAMGSILNTCYTKNNDQNNNNPKQIKKMNKKFHMWVITTDTIKTHQKVVFWEGLTGQQYDVYIDPTNMKCLFHQSLYEQNFELEQKKKQQSSSSSSSGNRNNQPNLTTKPTLRSKSIPNVTMTNTKNSSTIINNKTGISTISTTIPSSSSSSSSSSILPPPIPVQVQHPFYEIFALFNETTYLLNLQKHASLQKMIFEDSDNVNMSSTTSDENKFISINTIHNTTTNTTTTSDTAQGESSGSKKSSNTSSVVGGNVTSPIITKSNQTSSSKPTTTGTTSGTSSSTGATGMAVTTQTPYHQPLSFDFHNTHHWSEFVLENASLLRHPGTCLSMMTTHNTTLNHHEHLTHTSSSSSQLPLPQQQQQHRSKNINLFLNRPLSISLYDYEGFIEQQIQTMMIHWRQEEYQLMTTFDSQLSLILQPALISYETERCLGNISSSNEQDFQCMIRHMMKKKEILKAYPTCFSHVHVPSIILALKQTPLVKVIITGIDSNNSNNNNSSTTATGTVVNAKSTVPDNRVSRFGVRVKIFPYGELCAVWIMMAVCYTS